MPFERRDLLLDGVRDAVLRQQLADRAVLAFGAGAVVAEDVDRRSCCRACPGGRARRSACRPARRRARRSRRRSPSAGAGTGAAPRGCCPTRPSTAARGVSLVLAGIQPSCFCRANTRSRYASQPSSKRALVLVGPLLAHLVRAVRRAGRPVHEERLVGREGPMPPQPGDAARGDVLAQVVASRRAAARSRWCSRPAAAPTATSRRRGSRRSSRSRARSASGRTAPSRWSGRPACCATCRRRRSCSRSGAAPRPWSRRSSGMTPV